MSSWELLGGPGIWEQDVQGRTNHQISRYRALLGISVVGQQWLFALTCHSSHFHCYVRISHSRQSEASLTSLVWVVRRSPGVQQTWILALFQGLFLRYMYTRLFHAKVRSSPGWKDKNTFCHLSFLPTRTESDSLLCPLSAKELGE